MDEEIKLQFIQKETPEEIVHVHWNKLYLSRNSMDTNYLFAWELKSYLNDKIGN